MPIRPDLRVHYRGAAWRAFKRLVLERAGGRVRIGPRGGVHYEGGAKCEHCGKQLVQIGAAHLDQDPSNNSPENGAALCRGCHNRHDAQARAVNAKETRCQRKDARRPLLTPATANAPNPAA